MDNNGSESNVYTRRIGIKYDMQENLENIYKNLESVNALMWNVISKEITQVGITSEYEHLISFITDKLNLDNLLRILTNMVEHKQYLLMQNRYIHNFVNTFIYTYASGSVILGTQ